MGSHLLQDFSREYNHAYCTGCSLSFSSSYKYKYIFDRRSRYVSIHYILCFRIHCYCGLAYIALCSNGDVRLVGEHDSLLSGRLEICFNNQWGSVCATTQQPWTQNNAAVVCKQLGHSDTGQYNYNAA